MANDWEASPIVPDGPVNTIEKGWEKDPVYDPSGYREPIKSVPQTQEEPTPIMDALSNLGSFAKASTGLSGMDAYQKAMVGVLEGGFKIPANLGSVVNSIADYAMTPLGGTGVSPESYKFPTSANDPVSSGGQLFGQIAPMLVGGGTPSAFANVGRASLPRIAEQAAFGAETGAGSSGTTGGAGYGALFGGAGGALMETPAAVVNLTRGAVRGSVTPEMLKNIVESGNVSRPTNIPLSFGQKSGSRTALTNEAELRKLDTMEGSSMREVDKQTSDAFNQYFNNLTEKYKGANLSPEQIGAQVTGAGKKIVDDAFNARKTEWETGANKLAAITQNKPIVEPIEAVSALNRLIGENKLASGELTDVGKELMRVRNRLSATTPSLQGQLGGVPPKLRGLTATELKNEMSVVSAAAAGKGGWFEGIKDSAQERTLSGIVLNAMKKDLSRTADMPGGAEAGLLKNMRDNWASKSALIGEMENLPLMKMLGGANPKDATAVYNAIVKMNPTVIRQTTSLLDNASPAIMESVRGRYLKDLFSKNIDEGVPLGEQQLKYASLARDIKQDEKMLAMFPRKEERQQLQDASSALQAMLRHKLGEPKGQDPKGVIGNFAYGIANRNMGVAARGIIQSIAPKHIFNALTTPDGQKALITIATTNAKASTVNAAVNTLKSMSDSEIMKEKMEVDPEMLKYLK